MRETFSSVLLYGAKSLVDCSKHDLRTRYPKDITAPLHAGCVRELSLVSAPWLHWL